MQSSPLGTHCQREELPPRAALQHTCQKHSHATDLTYLRRGLTPRAVMHFASLNKWKLTSMAGWARIGDACPMENYDIRYAAPELLAADLRGVSPGCCTSHWLHIQAELVLEQHLRSSLSHRELHHLSRRPQDARH